MKARIPLPVDPERLRGEFPGLTDADLEAYEAVTRRVLADPRTRGRAMREVMDKAQQAEAKAASGSSLTREEMLLLRYLHAVARMQRSTVRRG